MLWGALIDATSEDKPQELCSQITSWSWFWCVISKGGLCECYGASKCILILSLQLLGAELASMAERSRTCTEPPHSVKSHSQEQLPSSVHQWDFFQSKKVNQIWVNTVGLFRLQIFPLESVLWVACPTAPQPPIFSNLILFLSTQMCIHNSPVHSILPRI